jgi:uncharacterized membrane protein
LAKKKKGNDLTDDEWKSCSFCGESIKLKNYEKHLERVHLDLDDEDIEDEMEEIRPAKPLRPHQSKRADQRKRLEAERRKKQDMYGFIGLIAIVGIIVIGYFAFTMGDGGKTLDGGNVNTLASNEVQVVPGTDQVQIPMSDVNDGKAHYYFYKVGGTEVDFFVLKSSDGIVRAAFDACDVCFNERKGYTQKGDVMECNNCGQQFASVKINEEKGGCNPAPLDRTVDGDNLVIKSGDLNSGTKYF